MTAMCLSCWWAFRGWILKSDPEMDFDSRRVPRIETSQLYSIFRYSRVYYRTCMDPYWRVEPSRVEGSSEYLGILWERRHLDP